LTGWKHKVKTSRMDSSIRNWRNFWLRIQTFYVNPGIQSPTYALTRHVKWLFSVQNHYVPPVESKFIHTALMFLFQVSPTISMKGHTNTKDSYKMYSKSIGNWSRPSIKAKRSSFLNFTSVVSLLKLQRKSKQSTKMKIPMLFRARMERWLWSR
jgi:hypothetical protein